MEKSYSVKELATLSGVSVRALHYYDTMGLLVPHSRSVAGYRLYGAKQLLRLQQILFYRKLEVPLKEILRILDDPEFDLEQALNAHRCTLLEREKGLKKLLCTLEQTLLSVKGGKMMVEKELYVGFSADQIERYAQEVEHKYDPKLVAESKKRIQKMSVTRWKQIRFEEDQVLQELSVCLSSGDNPTYAVVQALVQRHHAWVENFYPVTKEVYLGLAKLYVEHEGFSAHYDNCEPGLAGFLSAAMEYYGQSSL